MIGAICPLCHELTGDVLTSTLRRGVGTVFHCAKCDLGFLVGEKREGYYHRQYRDEVNHKAEGGETTPQEIFDTYTRYQQGRINIACPNTKMESVLEIGASAGQFLTHMKGIFARRCAIEPDPRCCAFMQAAGIETDANYLRNSRFYNEKFDVVCAFQVLEHVDEPRSFLAEVKHVLKPGGTAFIEVPNLYDPLRSVWGIPEYEKFYFHADHLFYFSWKSLVKYAVKAGFTKPQVFFTQDYSLLNHIHWLMNKAPQADCHVGLGPVKFEGKDSGMAAWLSHKLSALNEEYISMLESTGETSNLTMILTN